MQFFCQICLNFGFIIKIVHFLSKLSFLIKISVFKVQILVLMSKFKLKKSKFVKIFITKIKMFGFLDQNCPIFVNILFLRSKLSFLNQNFGFQGPNLWTFSFLMSKSKLKKSKFVKIFITKINIFGFKTEIVQFLSIFWFPRSKLSFLNQNIGFPGPNLSTFSF